MAVCLSKDLLVDLGKGFRKKSTSYYPKFLLASYSSKLSEVKLNRVVEMRHMIFILFLKEALLLSKWEVLFEMRCLSI